jgi:hypothetical protein
MFEQLGYFKEYYIENKYIGSIKTEKDREGIGYYGRQYEILLNDLFLENKKKIKKGTKINTVIYPINGRAIK